MNKKLLSLLIIVVFILLTSNTVVLADDEKPVKQAEEIQKEIEPNNKTTENEEISNTNGSVDDEKNGNFTSEEQEDKQKNTEQEERNNSQNQQDNKNEINENNGNNNKNEDDQIQEQQEVKEKVENVQEKQEDISPIKGNTDNETKGEEKDENQEQLTNVEEVTEQNEEFSIYLEVTGNRINPYFRDGIYYLFIPQEIKLNNVIINYSGKVTDISAGVINDNKTITNDFRQKDTIIITANEQQYQIKVMQSDLPSLRISLNNTTLSTINNGNKEIKYSGNTIDIKDPANTKNNLSVSDVEIKGRGNYTWGLPKKGYQIKLNKKQSVLGMEKAKTWILLANYMDNTFSRNKIAFDLAKDLGLNYTPDYRFVDLWIDGNYLGNYMITEKIQVNEKRVNLENINGIISEIDNLYYKESATSFRSNKSNTWFTLKDSVADDEGNEKSIAKQSFESFKNTIYLFEEYLYSENKDWNTISKFIDVDSFIKFYFIQELSEDQDGCRSSLFMYKDGIDDVIHMGPVWDYDIAFGNNSEEKNGGNPNVDYVINIQKYMDISNDWFNQLMQIKEFRNKVKELYNTEIKTFLNNINSQTYDNMQKSANMNNIIWNTLGKKSLIGRINKNSYAEECEYLKSWLQNRINYLDRRYSDNSEIINVKYKTHIQDIGWERKILEDGEMSGTSGQSKRLEAIIINLDTFNKDLSENLHVKYQVHAQDYGWMDWKEDGEIAGTSGQSKRLEAIRIKLNDNSEYSIRYRVHIQNTGWTDWIYDGNAAGTEGQSLRLEAIEIQIINNNNSFGEITPNSNALIKYKGHIENVGDTGYGTDGETIGSIGRSLRLEGLQIELGNSLPSDLSLSIDEHIENIGWVKGLTNKDYIGTQGRSLRLEALSFKLNGESAKNYTIKYRVHVQNIGWQDWKKDGEIAGTTGQSLRIEAIQIRIEPK